MNQKQAIESYSTVSKRKNRADKETLRFFMEKSKESSIVIKERWSIELIKMALSKAKRPVISCSFGIDSIVTIYLVRKALIELDRDPSGIDIIWNDTLNEFPEVRLYSKKMVKEWNLKLIKTIPHKPLRAVIDDAGGLDASYFTARKGDRRNGKPLSEKCCDNLKHKPMNKAIEEHDWDLCFNGVRADESYIRETSGKKDGEYYYSIATWKSFMCRPIMWWKEEDVWEYVNQEKIPFNSLYERNMIQEYPVNITSLIRNYKQEFKRIKLDATKLKNKELLYVTRLQAIILEKLGFKIFKPRTGCMMCPIPIRFGYLHWMRLNHPKVYKAMIFNLGYGEALKDLLPEDVRKELEEVFGLDFRYDDVHLQLKDMLDYKPCMFDKLDNIKGLNDGLY